MISCRSAAPIVRLLGAAAAAGNERQMSPRAVMGSTPAELHAPRAQCDRYTDETYGRMRDDAMRTSAYRRAIEQHAPGRTCVDIGTGALALLAVIAARAGAEHVFAIEANAEAAAAARAAVADQGLAERITVLEGYSTDVTLPRPADLVIHEILGEIASAEGVVSALVDAGRRHLGPAGGGGAPVSIPARARTLVAPCEFPGSDYFDALPFPMLAAPGAQVLKLPGLPRELLLSAAQPFEDLRFEAAAPEASHARELRFTVQRSGEVRGEPYSPRSPHDTPTTSFSAVWPVARLPSQLRGLALHLELFFSDDSGEEQPETAPGVSSADPGSHWANVFVLLEPVEVREGATLLVRTTAELEGATPQYTFQAWLGEQGDEREPEAMRCLGEVVRYP